MGEYKIINIHPTYESEKERDEKIKEVATAIALEYKKLVESEKMCKDSAKI